MGKTFKKIFDVDILYGLALLAAIGGQALFVGGYLEQIPSIAVIGGTAAVIGLGVAIKERFF